MTWVSPFRLTIPERYAAAVETLLNDGDARNAFAARGRKYAEDTFGIAEITNAFEKVFSQALKRKKNA